MEEEEYDYPKLRILVFCLVAFGCLPAGAKAKKDETTGLRPQVSVCASFLVCFVKLFALEWLLKLQLIFANRKDKFHSMIRQLCIS